MARHIFEVNYFAATEFTREALPLLRQGNQPMIVNIGSILGHRAIPFSSAYCASKFALSGWSESLRAELAPQGVQVLVVSPGTTNTEFFDHLVENRIKVPWHVGKGVSAQSVARQTVLAMERGKREIVTGWGGWWLLALHRLSPGLVDRLMARFAGQAYREK